MAAVNLLRNALQRKPRSDLLEHYSDPHLYHPGPDYLYTSPDLSRFGQEPGIGVEYTLERLIH
jgi:hypothetical protein